MGELSCFTCWVQISKVGIVATNLLKIQSIWTDIKSEESVRKNCTLISLLMPFGSSPYALCTLSPSPSFRSIPYLPPRINSWPHLPPSTKVHPWTPSFHLDDRRYTVQSKTTHHGPTQETSGPLPIHQRICASPRAPSKWFKEAFRHGTVELYWYLFQ